ncbi:PQQ-dependent sugar dehydrogenase [Actinomarinicola tropica]|uniref:Sugar dehydrogenase n=1 Tax=Actinomarinicola tropica TaxID=2789776 RepID=A0A5Q2RP73_9ACTN|nr:PQQ-dependent sugar dehydrogenase [Actinomarinicola tropica]QGG96391.1 sugar dehydrogenase [Actinomarinicola tropica]
MTRRRPRSRRAALAVVLPLLLGACAGDDDGDVTGQTAVVPDVTTTSTTGPPSSSTTETTEPEPPSSVEDLSGAAITLTEIASLDAPTAMASRPGSDVLYVAERGGTVRPLTRTPVDAGTQIEVGEPVLDVGTTTDGERGLLGLAFSPDGTQLFLSYTDTSGDTQLDVYDVDGDAVLPDSRRPVFATGQPYANHNGGHVAFGPDGHLYLGLGDGGGGGDPLRTAQDPSDVLGSILRFDPADLDAAPEVWTIGVRNPWRYSWDRETGDLWIADVGQNAVEEVTVVPASGDEPPGRGANLGWPIFEGSLPYDGGPEPEGYVAPIFDYEHGPGCSITGGYVSRGEALAGLRGAYLYSDYCDPTIRALLVRDGVLVDERALDVDVPGGQVASFAEGADGELYVLSLAGGIYRIDPA